MVPIEKLSRDNFLSVVDVSMDIKTALEMAPPEQTSVFIPLLQHRVKFQILFPIDSIGVRDHYCDLRWDATKYLKNNGHIEDFKHSSSMMHRWDDDIQIFCNPETFLDFYERLIKVYKERVHEPEKRNEALDTLSDEQIEKLHKILEILAIRLSMSHPPHIIYIPVSQFPNDIQQFDLIGLLYKLDKELKVLSFSNIVGTDPTKQEFEIRFVKKGIEEEFRNLKTEIDKRYKTIANNKPKITVTEPEEKVSKIMIVQGSEIAVKNTLEEKKFQFPYKLPRGTKWENFVFKFLDDDTVQVLVKGKMETLHYRDMGLEGKGGKPSVLWIFLRVLAKRSGEIAITDPEANTKYKKQKQGLSEALQSYFSIDFDPFHPYATEKAYKTKFVIAPPEKGFTFEKKTPARETPKENNPFADIDDYMNETAPVIAQTGAIPPDDER